MKAQSGFSSVEISKLRDELGIGQKELETILLKESKQGNAVLSFGDWSLSSEEIRSGAINIDGKPHSR